jgi:hypothetical protein
MHIFAENCLPNLVKLWTERFPGIPPGSDFEIDDELWEQIGLETAASVANIPAAFVRVLGNIADDRSTYTAES